MISRGLTALSQAVRPRVLAKHVGELALALTGLAAVPAIVAIVAGRFGVAAVYGTAVAVLTIGGMALNRLAVPEQVQRNEALVATVAVFLLAALTLAVAFVAEGLPIPDAVFEAVSAITTTGLTTLASVEDESATFLFARAWGQWYGGLVIVVLAAAVILEPGAAARRLTPFEGRSEDLAGGTRGRARRVLAIYAGLTGVSLALVWITMGDGFAALLHTLSAVSTGGFSSFDDSLVGAPPAARIAVIGVGFIAAMSLSVIYRAWRREWRAVANDASLRALLIAGVAVTAVLVCTMTMVGSHDLWDALARAPLLAFSAQATSGFTPADIGTLDPGSKLALIVSMMIGGDAGATAGGIKIVRLLILLRMMHLVIARTALPQHAVAGATATGRPVDEEEVRTTVSVVLLFATGVTLSWFVFLVAGHPALDALFDVASAFGTVGLSTGVVGPDLATSLKLLLCLDMLMGRLEVVAILVVFYPRTWFGRRPVST